MIGLIEILGGGCITKKRLLTILAIVSLFFVVAVGTFFAVFGSDMPAWVTREWQRVYIPAFGLRRLPVRVPTEWNVEEEDGILYITDKPRAYGDYTIYIVGASGRNGLPHALHEVFEGIERGDVLRVISSGTGFAFVYFVEYTVNGVQQVHYEIILQNYTMFVLNPEVVDEWHADQIRRTFLLSNYLDLISRAPASDD